MRGVALCVAGGADLAAVFLHRGRARVPQAVGGHPPVAARADPIQVCVCTLVVLKKADLIHVCVCVWVCVCVCVCICVCVYVCVPRVNLFLEHSPVTSRVDEISRATKLRSSVNTKRFKSRADHVFLTCVSFSQNHGSSEPPEKGVRAAPRDEHALRQVSERLRPEQLRRRGHERVQPVAGPAQLHVRYACLRGYACLSLAPPRYACVWVCVYVQLLGKAA